ncbi:hypothetical protein DRN62_00415 [Nanoarchaeota archaeon]|nr:MAG: hypothetical protein DRN62_00415 [Nanoarchaeota archaeon]
MRYDGKRFLVTAGPTIEYIDPIRVISNRSSGRMGIIFSEEVLKRGGEVNLVLGHTPLSPPNEVKLYRVETTEEMKKKVEELLREGKFDIFFSAAAVADYKPSSSYSRKLSTREEKEIVVRLVPTPKIIRSVKRISPDIILVAFKAELTPDEKVLEERARLLMKESKCDVVISHDVSRKEAGFLVDRISGLIVTHEGVTPFDGGKRELSVLLLDEIIPGFMR